MQMTLFSDLLGSHLYSVWTKSVLLKAPHDWVKKKKGGGGQLQVALREAYLLHDSAKLLV